MNATGTTRDLQKLADEHDQLGREIEEWRQWWAEVDELGVPHFGEMGTRLSQLRDDLAAHLKREEQVGLLLRAPEELPEFQRVIPRLKAEHDQLLAQLDGIIDRLCACEPCFTSWGEARAGFEAFVQRLEKHETAERRLIQVLQEHEERTG